ncbi:MAG TPA: hypothetical protein VI893_10210, partial [Thermoplasmata archaeon]|nr:hypothetical protein [Thermoplasmata archaeon]
IPAVEGAKPAADAGAKPSADGTKPAAEGSKPTASPAKPAARAKTRPKAAAPTTKAAPAPKPAEPATKPAAPATKPAEPQGPTPTIVPESERVARELDRTDRVIARAKRTVEKSKNGRALKALASASDFQADAREAQAQHQYARSQRLTLAAREYADRASRMVGPPREDPEYVESVLKRTDDALDRAKDVLQNGADRHTWDQHESLKHQQKDAWKTFKEGRIEDGYKATLAVRSGVLNLLRKIDDLPVPRETAEKAIDGAKAAMERANKDLGPKPGAEALRFVRLANSYLSKARVSYDRRSYRDALLQAKVVEQNLEKAVDAARPRG